MGIPGLTSFINRNSTQFFENYQLKDTLIIIDGFALTNFLYKLYENQTSAFGGDYDTVANVYRDFINLLLRCNVTPIFVFDGAYEQRKIETIMSRMSGRIQTYGQAIKTCDCMPYFASDIIFDILNDMDVPHVSCDFEADAEIVALAKLLKCPVLSRDSDFYLDRVPYIPLDMILLDLKSQELFINCRLYRVEKLLQEFGGISLNYLPLVAALMGNDYIRTDTFALPLRLSPGTFNSGLKLKKISEWLRRQKDVNSAIYNMTHHLTHSKDYIKKQIQNIIQEYENTESKYLPFILQYKCMNKFRANSISDIKEKYKCILPGWLENNYRKGTVNATIMTLITMRKMFFKIQIDNYEKPPYYLICMRVVETIAGLLFGKSDTFLSFGRKNGFNQGTYKLKPLLPNPYVPLMDLNKTDLEYRKNIILKLVRLPKLSNIPKEWEVFILALTYWATHTNNQKSNCIPAFVVCAITLNFVNKTNNGSENQPFKIEVPENKMEESICNLKNEDCIRTRVVLSKYETVSEYNDKKFYNKTIHSFAQLQGSIYFMMILNSILDFPFGQCRVENFFKGTLLYNLCVEMDKCDSKLFVLEKIFCNSESLATLYSSIIEILEVLFATPLVKRKMSSASGSKSQTPNKTKIFNKNRKK
ncbi:protein asteroid homolog 1-like isoform X2 [Adelges cooleyi]|nr:protein asteroid homolog 1-like isoform X2 [Adelges cooleyi]